MTNSVKAENMAGASRDVARFGSVVAPGVSEHPELSHRNVGQQRRIIRRQVFSSTEPGQNQRVVMQPSVEA